MLSQQEMSDRLEIQDLLTAYCFAIDSRNWAALDDIFTPDAMIDYTAAGGEKGDLTFIKKYLDKALKKFPNYQHMISAPSLQIDADQATARSILFNPMVMEGGHVMFVGMWYCDKLVRTDKGWRIAQRSEELSYFHNIPEGFAPD